MMMENLNSTVLVNYGTADTSITDNIYQTPTELTDNLSFALKNNIIIDYSFAEIEKSDVNKDSQKDNIEKQATHNMRYKKLPGQQVIQGL